MHAHPQPHQLHTKPVRSGRSHPLDLTGFRQHPRFPLVPLSPCPLVSLSPCLLVPLSPCLPPLRSPTKPVRSGCLTTRHRSTIIHMQDHITYSSSGLENVSPSSYAIARMIAGCARDSTWRPMNTKKLTAVLCLCTMSLFVASCGPGQILGPTATPTPTPTPTATPTPTPVPGGVVAGRVYLMDRDEPVRTAVRLALREGFEEVDHTETDEDGYYSFVVEEPGTYVIQVSVMDLLDTCDNLRTESGGWMATQLFDESGVADIRASSPGMDVTIGDEITLDCELYCD